MLQAFKSMVLVMEKKGGFQHGSGASDNFFEFTPSKTLENALLTSRVNITFIIYLVLLWPFTYICFKGRIMAQG